MDGSARQPGDESVPEEDTRLLAELAAARGGDPLPPGLVDRVSELIGLQDLEHDLAALLEDAELVGVRSSAPADVPELTFESGDGSVSLDVTVTPEAVSGTVSVEAAGPLTVQLLRRDGAVTPLSVDSLGRFALSDPAPGPARLRVVIGGAVRAVTDWFVV